MIYYKTGDLFESNAYALVNTVNTVGVMGKGIALQFKKLFPNNYKAYYKACKDKELIIGKLFIVNDESILTGKKLIINFPTKTDWKKPSEYSYITEGLKALKVIISKKNIKSIAIPPLGAGNGGLKWSKVKLLIEEELNEVDCDIYIYEPNAKIIEVMKNERIKLTPARAMLLSVLYDLVRNGEFVSEFAAEKVAYFLQIFGAKDSFKLEFKPYFYGPYSGKVRHVLYRMNGSYIMGYSTKDKKPFEELGLVPNGEKIVSDFLSMNENLKYKQIADKTKEFLQGFYSPFGLELLSTIDYIKTSKKDISLDNIGNELDNWSNRKRSLFHNSRFIEIANRKIEDYIEVMDS